MATRAVSMVLTYRAWDTSANAPKTGDVANHTLKWIKDGTSSSTTNSASEVDATNAKGIYKVTMTSTETDCLMGTLAGVSSTSNIALFGAQVAFDQIPNAVAGASGGLFIAGSNAATTVNVTGNITGNLSGSVGSVTGAVGSVTGAVGSVTAGVTVTTNSDKTGYALTSGDRNAVADALLDRDMSLGADSGSTTVRTARQALRFLRNKWSISGSVLTVCKEDDSATSWTAATTQTAGNPVSAIDPAGP